MSTLDRLFVQAIRVTQRGQSDERGQGLAEYALILGLVALVCIGALSTLGGGITNAYNSMTAAF